MINGQTSGAERINIIIRIDTQVYAEVIYGKNLHYKWGNSFPFSLKAQFYVTMCYIGKQSWNWHCVYQGTHSSVLVAQVFIGIRTELQTCKLIKGSLELCTTFTNLVSMQEINAWSYKRGYKKDQCFTIFENILFSLSGLKKRVQTRQNHSWKLTEILLCNEELPFTVWYFFTESRSLLQRAGIYQFSKVLAHQS